MGCVRGSHHYAQRYFLASLGDDKIGGSRIKDSRESVFSIGPDVAYQKGPWLVNLKVLWEAEATNRPQGVASWLRLVYSF